MQIIQKRKFAFIFSGILTIASIAVLLAWGLRLGIDFTNGILIETKFQGQPPAAEDIQRELADFNLTSLTIQPTEEGTTMIRYVSSDDEVNQQVQQRIREKFEGASIERVEFTTTSGESRSKAIQAVILAAIGIAAYIAWAFRQVSYPVTSWKYGLSAIIALLHDILITVGVFSVLGKYYGVEINIPFIAALLTILGYSVNDTIVVFDRVRENLLRAGAKRDFEETVNKSINETLARSINTSMTVILVLVAIVLLGGASIKYFALALLIGVFFGTYSSVFVASALLVESWKWQQRA